MHISESLMGLGREPDQCEYKITEVRLLEDSMAPASIYGICPRKIKSSV